MLLEGIAARLRRLAAREQGSSCFLQERQSGLVCWTQRLVRWRTKAARSQQAGFQRTGDSQYSLDRSGSYSAQQGTGPKAERAEPNIAGEP
jgi:hypothetical protein